MRGDGATLVVSFPQFFGHPLERHIAPRHAFLVASGRPSGGDVLCISRLPYFLLHDTVLPRRRAWVLREAVCCPYHACGVSSSYAIGQVVLKGDLRSRMTAPSFDAIE